MLAVRANKKEVMLFLIVSSLKKDFEIRVFFKGETGNHNHKLIESFLVNLVQFVKLFKNISYPYLENFSQSRQVCSLSIQNFY